MPDDGMSGLVIGNDRQAKPEVFIDEMLPGWNFCLVHSESHFLRTAVRSARWPNPRSLFKALASQDDGTVVMGCPALKQSSRWYTLGTNGPTKRGAMCEVRFPKHPQDAEIIGPRLRAAHYPLTFAVSSLRLFPVSKAGPIIVIAASVIAAIRLVREPIGNTPKVAATISDSITLAKMIFDRTARTYPELFGQ
jgi:hypothetical protein